jgi:hypothetical protein
VAVSVLYRAGDPWVDLTDRVLETVQAGHVVMWVSLSGTIQLFAGADGFITRLRRGAAGSVHAGDGLPLLVEAPFFATACGCGDGSGYRSTPPLGVGVIDTAADVEALYAEARRLAEELVAAGYDPARVPDGHPDGPCPALYCPRARGYDLAHG